MRNSLENTSVPSHGGGFATTPRIVPSASDTNRVTVPSATDTDRFFAPGSTTSHMMPNNIGWEDISSDSEPLSSPGTTNQNKNLPRFFTDGSLRADNSFQVYSTSDYHRPDHYDHSYSVDHPGGPPHSVEDVNEYGTFRRGAAPLNSDSGEDRTRYVVTGGTNPVSAQSLSVGTASHYGTTGKFMIQMPHREASLGLFCGLPVRRVALLSAWYVAAWCVFEIFSGISNDFHTIVGGYDVKSRTVIHVTGWLMGIAAIFGVVGAYDANHDYIRIFSWSCAVKLFVIMAVFQYDGILLAHQCENASEQHPILHPISKGDLCKETQQARIMWVFIHSVVLISGFASCRQLLHGFEEVARFPISFAVDPMFANERMAVVAGEKSAI